MTIDHKIASASGAEMYLIYPGTQRRTPFKRRSVTILSDGCTEASVRRMMGEWELEKLALEHEIILCFPVAPEGEWGKSGFAANKALVAACQEQMNKPDDAPPKLNSIGIPTMETMLSTWHPMNDTKYFVGTGSGATLALSLAASAPANMAAVLAVGGELLPEARENPAESPIPVCLMNADAQAAAYFHRVNGTELRCLRDGYEITASSRNPLQMTVLPAEGTALNGASMRWVWQNVFLPVRRTNTCVHGDVEPSMDLAAAGFKTFVEVDCLGDGLKHTWFVHCPTRACGGGGQRFPLMMFYHGGSDNPAEAAEMSKFHELGEREGFITVYPWGTNRCGWNSAMQPDQEDDVDFCARLIDYMIEHYPVDRERVYLSGFSNGAAMAQTVALIHPEKIAAICHIDSNWPGVRGGYAEVADDDVIPFKLGMQRKETYDYRIPVWYTYGSRELSYPVFYGSTQQNQYDFWKRYNRVPVRPTPRVGEENPTGCGVRGDESETLRPSVRHPAHFYQVQRFWSDDPQPLNLYNYVVMHDKGHEVAEMDAELGRRYVRRFRRHADGSLGVEND